MAAEVVIPSPSLVVLVGPSSSGKSTWAEEHFRPGQVLSTDYFRALYGSGPADQTAGTEAFALLDSLIEVRLRKGLTTVVDTIGLDPTQRERYRAAAAAAKIPCVAIGFDTDPALCHDRNQTRTHRLPKSVLDKQIRQWRTARESLAGEGFDVVITNPGPPRLVAPTMASSDGADDATAPEGHTGSPNGRDTAFAFDLVISSFNIEGDYGPTLIEMAKTAERVGFRSLWLMDHFRQVPQIGRAWDPMLEPYTSLAYLAAAVDRLRFGTLVTGIEHRNVGLLAKIIATLDVLSGGRAECGVGAGWFDAEQAAFGYPVNDVTTRLDTLEDALQALPILWGPGSKAFHGKVVSIPEALAYPRPVQDPVPILVGGGGERRTLALAARYGHAANVMGDPETVRHKIEVLRSHCETADRDPGEVMVTTLNPIIHAGSGRELSDLIERLRPANRSAEAFAAATNAATTAEHVERFGQLASLGVGRACVAFTGDNGPERIEAFGDVIDAFASGTPTT